jgi:Tol biopolymer transport system component
MKLGSFVVLALIWGCSSEGRPAAPAVEDSGNVELDAVVDAADAADAPGETATDASYPVPTPDDLQFKALNPLPSGEQLVFNDWNSSPNRFLSMKPDGTEVVRIFEVYRVWSAGVSRKGDKIAFSCADPKQKEHYGLDIGDSIQHTWMYDVATQTIEPIAIGNLNDECHQFSADGSGLYVCRRYDFAETETEAGVTGTNKGWRIARIALSSKVATFLTPESKDYALGPNPTNDESTLWYSITTFAGSTQIPRVVKQSPPGGSPVDVRANAARPVLSPDGTHYAFNAVTTFDKSAIHVSKLDGSEEVTVTKAAGTNASFSPDGTHLAYLVYDPTKSCQHIEIVATDGSDVAAPKRVRDCGTSAEFITELAWISR